MTGEIMSFDEILEKYEIKRWVNEGNKTVTLKIEPYGGGLLLIAKIASQLGFSRNIWDSGMNVPYFGISPARLTATSKCSQADVFNIEIGTKVAFAKLQNKIKRNLIRSIVDVHKDSEKTLKNVYRMIDLGKLDTYNAITPKAFDYICNMYRTDDYEADEEDS